MNLSFFGDNMDLCNLSVIKQIMSDAGITFRKEFGQNFLINRIIPEDIADNCADTEDSLIIEIGPGNTLSGFLKKTAKELGKEITIFHVEDGAGLSAVISRLEENNGERKRDV